MGPRTPSTPKPGGRPIRGKKAAPRDLNIRLERDSGKQRIDRWGRATLTDTTFRFRTGRTGDQGADFFVHIDYDELASVVLDASSVSLTLTTAEGASYRLHIGKHAPAWKEYLQKPVGGRLALFGITSKTRVALLALPDTELADEIEDCVPGAGAVPSGAGDLQAIFFGAEHPADLARLAEHARRLKKPGGVLWVVYPTGARGLTEEQVVKTAAAVGLVRRGAVVLSRAYEAVGLYPIG